MDMGIFKYCYQNAIIMAVYGDGMFFRPSIYRETKNADMMSVDARPVWSYR